jgi:hypothetical protein
MKGDAMSFADLFEGIAHRRAQPHTTLAFPDPDPGPAADGAAGGYFQLRLASMVLRDDRTWFQEVVPATFVLTDFNYGKETVRQPFFVSNQLLSLMPEGIDARELRVRFRNTLVAGPMPYAGGDVGLFVGLFRSAIGDWRRDMFSVFETLFGNVDFGLLSQYVKVADKLSGEILRCLGGEDIKCLLAERSVIGQHTCPQPGYLAYLRASGRAPDTAHLVVRDDTLQRNGNGGMAPVTDLDYCLIRIDRLATRNDYSKMEFNTTWRTACQQRRAGSLAEAQALMLHCANQIDASPDLSEDDKSALIELYQSKLLAVAPLVSRRGPGGAATRSGAPSAVRDMQARASKYDRPGDKSLAGPYDRIAELTAKLSKAPEANGKIGDIGEAEIAAHVSARGGTPRPPASVLVRALAAGSVASG